MKIYQIVDGSAIFSKMYFAADKNFMEASKGCLAWLGQYLEKAPPYRTIIVFDTEASGSLKRRLSSTFKPAPTEKLDKLERKHRYKFFEYLKEILPHLGYIVASPKRIEPDADDVVGFLASKISKHYPVIVRTTDRDLLQIVNDANYTAILGYDSEDLTQKINYQPRHTVLHKAFVGKPGEVKGIPRFGEKAWESLQEDIGLDGLDELVEFFEKKRPMDELREIISRTGQKQLKMLGENLSSVEADYFLSRLQYRNLEHPANIKYDKRVPATLDYMLENFDLVEPNLEVFSDYLQESWVSYKPERVGEILHGNDEGLLAFDYESYDIHPEIEWHNEDFVAPLYQEVTGASFCSGVNLNRTLYLPINHKTEDCLQKEELTEQVKHVLSEAEELVVHNVPFEYIVSKVSLAIPYKKLDKAHFIDTSQTQKYVDPTSPQDLKSLSERYLKYKQITYDEVIAHSSDGTMRGLTPDQVAQYALDDALVTANIWALHRVVLMVSEQYHLRQETLPLQRQLCKSYVKGVDCDWDSLAAREKANDEYIADGYSKIRELLSILSPGLSEERAMTYFAQIEREEKMLLLKRYDGNRQKVADAMARLYDRILLATEYTPYKEEVVPVKMVMTPAFFNPVLEALGLPEFTAKSISGVGWKRYFNEVQPLKDEKQKEFMNLVMEVIPFMKLKEGDEWDDLERFSVPLSGRKPKIVESGTKIEIGSAKQMQMLLYVMLGAKIHLRSDVKDYSSSRAVLGLDGAPSTADKAFFLALREDFKEGSLEYEIVETIAKMKKKETEQSFFCRPWKNWKYLDGKLRPQFFLNSTVTHRPTGSSPNFLQVPSGSDIRDVILPPEGKVFVSVDFNNQEIRIMADETRDEALLSCYLGDDKKNLHTLTSTAIARRVYAGYFPNVLPEMEEEEVDRAGHIRKVQVYSQFEAWYKGKGEYENTELHEAAVFCRSKRAKACNFTVAFGGTEYALASNLLIPIEEATEYIEDLHSMYPRIRGRQEEVAKVFAVDKFIRNPYGAVYFPNPRVFGNSRLLSKASRTAFNFLMQGTAGNVLYKTALNLDKNGLFEYDVDVLFPIYDELVFAIPHGDLDDFETCLEIIDKSMSITPPGHTVPQVAEFSIHPIGAGWASGVEIGTIDKVTKESISKALHKEEDGNE